MPYVIPPMDPEPPGDYIAFVTDHLAVLQTEAARLVGGGVHADEVYPEALTDVAGHWRRLQLIGRLRQSDATADFLRRRLATRAKQWREDQIYEVEVIAMRPPTAQHNAGGRTRAQRLAPLLPSTARASYRPIAEAAIAWSHAYSQHRWRRLARGAAAAVLIFAWFQQLVSHLTAR